MKTNLKEKFLNHSNSYIFYKEQYEILSKENQKQQNEIRLLKEEVNSLKGNDSFNSLKKLLFSKVFLTQYYNLFKESLDNVSNPRVEEKTCPICGSNAMLFLPVNRRKDALCYNCGSFERQRLIYLYLKRFTNIFTKENSFLHFAPEECLYNKFINSRNINYLTGDVEKNSRVKQIIDMCNIQFEDNKFDYIMANHVLEHVPDDFQAMRELYRTVTEHSKTGGKVILTVPIFTKYDETLEKEEYNTDELRIKYYGQKDHLRAYGNDFQERLESVGFNVKKYNVHDICSDEEIIEYGLLESDIIFECKK